MGATGLGPIACTGDTGPAGTPGAKGDKGDPGDQGEAGDQGPKGDPGVKGDPGAQGDPGVKGDKGEQGEPGGTVILSEKARLGLTLAPVPLDLAGLDGDAIESVGRGAYLMNAVADCNGCHSGQAGYLSGNNDFPIGPFQDAQGNTVDGHVFSRNLTPDATTGLKLTEAQFLDAMRRGVDHHDAAGKTSLLVMPWAQTRWMTDRDLKDMYAYLRRIPAVSNAVQADVKPAIPPGPSPLDAEVPVFTDGDVERPLPMAFDAAAGHPTLAAAERADDDEVLRGLAISPLADDEYVAIYLSPEEVAAYGRGSYIVNGPGLCNECHTLGGRDPQTGKVRTGSFLAGGQAFAVPPPLQPLLGQVRSMSANLVGQDYGVMGNEPFSVFVSTLVSGLSFSMGAPHVLGFPMPADVYRNLTIDDKAAVYTYLSLLQFAGLVADDAQHQAPARFCATVDDCEDGEACSAITINGAPTHECTGAACDTAADCGACQTCEDKGSGKKCQPESPTSTCALTSF